VARAALLYGVLCNNHPTHTLGAGRKPGPLCHQSKYTTKEENEYNNRRTARDRIAAVLREHINKNVLNGRGGGWGFALLLVSDVLRGLSQEKT